VAERFQLTHSNVEDNLRQVSLQMETALIVRSSKFKVLVFLLAGWPLVLPSGMCICQFAQGGHAGQLFSGFADLDDDEAICTPDACDCGDGHPGIPGEDNHAPGCPANQHADHSKLPPGNPLLNTIAPAATPLAVSVSCPSMQRLHNPPSLLLFERPLYLSLCILLI
jgi:hypothetical protein